jgi:urease accessory protein
MRSPAGHSRKLLVLLVLLVLPLLLLASGAQAHVGEGAAGGFWSGLGHPVSGLDHVAAMVAVGLWGAQLGAPAIWLLPVMFPIVMALGGFLGLVGVPFPSVEIGIALSAIGLGAAVLLQLRPPLLAATFAISAFALFHGHAHGTEGPPGESGLLYSLGFVMATGSLHALGIGIGSINRWSWGERALQGAGAIVVTAGSVFLWQALA